MGFLAREEDIRGKGKATVQPLAIPQRLYEMRSRSIISAQIYIKLETNQLRWQRSDSSRLCISLQLIGSNMDLKHVKRQ